VNQGSDMDSIAFFTRLFAYIYPLVFAMVLFVMFCLGYTLTFAIIAGYRINRTLLR
jgi:peptidoglycan/LPS O-acetylase OafA/YrhL